MFAPELADTISGMDLRSFDALSKVETKHFWFVVRNELTTILRAEIRMTLAGLNWPAGGSRVVVGRAI